MTVKAMKQIHVVVVGVKLGDRKEKRHIVELGCFPAETVVASAFEVLACEEISVGFKAIKSARLNIWDAELNEETGIVTVVCMGLANQRCVLEIGSGW